MFEIRNKIAGVAAATMMLFASAANAVTIEFDTLLSGVDLGSSSIATLEANDVAGGVQMTLTNNAVVGGINTFLTQLWMTYAGAVTDITGITNDAGVATKSFTKYPSGQVNAGYTWDMVVEWETSNAGGGINRLNIGESSTFTLLGATLTDLFKDEPFAMLHVQGLDGGGSTKYGGSCPPGSFGCGPDVGVVPLPAGLPLLLSAFGVGAFVTRRNRKQA